MESFIHFNEALGGQLKSLLLYQLFKSLSDTKRYFSIVYFNVDNVKDCSM